MRLNLIPALIVLAISAQPACAGVGRIKKVVGPVLVERSGKSIPAASGFVLEKGDRILTRKGGRVGATFNDNSRFAVGPDSDISIPEFQFDDTTHQGQFLANIKHGMVAIVSGQIAHSAKDAMKVRTPSALLGVRGTRFVVEVK